MGFDTDYYSILNKILSIQTITLLPAFLFTLIHPPKLETFYFAASPQFPNADGKAVNVPKYPTAKALGFLILIYVSDLIILHSYTLEKNAAVDNDKSMIIRTFLAFGDVLLIVRVMMGFILGMVRPSWPAAEKNLGLWHHRTWSACYMSFNLMTVALGVALIFEGIRFSGIVLLEVVPVCWRALYSAYGSLYF
jgi:hypothetical protein